MSIQTIRRCFLIGELMPGFFENLRLGCEHTPGQPGALAGDMTIEATPTWYGGTTFRSYLEACWAATLDTLGTAWEYEPERLTLPSGTVYIPDFWLPEIGTWLEVKGTGVPRVEKAIELGEARACRCDGRCTCEWPEGELVVIGRPPEPYRAELPLHPDSWDYRRARVMERKHGGHPVWDVAHGRSAMLTRCLRCRRGSWTRSRWCRACGEVLTWHAYQSGDRDLEFIGATARPAPDLELPPLPSDGHRLNAA